MYVILNIHWDDGWLENNVTTTAQASVNAKQQNYWTQIANYFKGYNEHLLFASANEPNASDATGMSVLLSYHQTFVNAVRATGGNNSSRTLIIQGPQTNIGLTHSLMNTLPTDQIVGRMMVEVHFYEPYQFSLMTQDADWGKMFYYWGTGAKLFVGSDAAPCFPPVFLPIRGKRGKKQGAITRVSCDWLIHPVTFFRR